MLFPLYLYFACHEWEMMEEKTVQFGLEKKQSIMGSSFSPKWRLLTNRLNNLFCWGLSLIKCLLLTMKMLDCNFLGLARFHLQHFIFTASVAAETTVSTKLESNHFLHTTRQWP